MVALCWGWLIYDAVAQVDDAADDGILTVGQCIDANVSFRPVEEALVKEAIIEKDLLQTNVTNGMCEDMLERTSDGTPVRMLVAAQNYVQEIALIEGAMRRVASSAAAKGTERHSLAAEPLGVAATLVALVQSTAEPSPEEASPWPATPEPSAEPSLEPPPEQQTPEPSAEPSLEPSPEPPSEPSASASVIAEPSLEPPPEQQTPDGEGDGSEVTLRTEQAAAAASVGEDDDASIAERLHEKEAAAKKEGASAPEAAAGARCGVEVDVLDDEVEEIEGIYEVKPLMPEEMRRGETEQAGLLVSPAAKERLQEIRQKHGVIAEASESNIGCVVLADRMKAKLVAIEELAIDRHQPDDIRELSPNQSTRWGWNITARQTGEKELLLDLSFAISREGSEFRPLKEPVYQGAIRVTPLQSDSTQNATEREAAEQPWWRRILARIFGVFGA